MRAVGGGTGRPAGAAVAGLCVLAAGLGFAERAAAQVRLTQQQALRLAFPEPANIERRTAFLTDAQLQRAGRLAGSDVAMDERVITYYVGASAGQPLGVAYFDAHTVRTLPEVLMIVVNRMGRIERIEILRFLEPPEYMAPDGWLAQFEGKDISSELSVKGSIVNITGATLTSQAVSRASRRVLALHEVIEPLAATPRPEPR